MSKDERADYKKEVIKDFIDHGMTDKEALVNYVFCVNPDPLNWLVQRHQISNEEAESLRAKGMLRYRTNGGTKGCRGVEPSAGRRAAAGTCKCRRPITPK